MSDAGLDIIIKARNDAEKALKQVSGQLDDVEKKGHNAAGGIDKLAGVLKGALVAAIGAVSIKALADGLGSMVGAAMEAEDIQADLNATLASTKGVSGMTTESINDLALSLSKVTRFEDDTITSAQSMLLTFTNIGKNVFPETTEAALNMATKFKMDTSQAAIILGKALNDPIAGVGALRRIGVQLTDQQEAQIKTMLDAKDGMWAFANETERATLMEKAQKIILGELNTEIGGVARAAGETAAGKMDILKNKFGNIQEEIGAKFLPLLTKLADGLSKALDSPEVQNGINMLMRGLDNLVQAIPPLWSRLQGLWTQLQGLATSVMPMLGQAIDFLVQNWDTLKGALVAAGAVLAGVAVAGAIAGIAAGLAGLLSPIGLIVAAAALLGAAWSSDFGGIRTTLTAFWESTAKPIFEELQKWLGENVPVAMKALSDFWTNTLSPAFEAMTSYVNEYVIPALSGLWAFITTYITPIFNSLANVLSAGIGYWFRQIGTIWTETLKPAFEAIVTYLDGDTGPKKAFDVLAGALDETTGLGYWFKQLKTLWTDTLKPAVDGMGTAFGDVKDILSGIKGWLDSIAAAINSMPTWTPPWDNALSFSLVGNSIAGAGGLGTGHPGGYGASYATSYSNVNSNNPAYTIQVNDGMSGALLMDQMRREQERRITRYM